MKPRTILAMALLALTCTPAMADPLGTAFTYQGKLNDGANPANGLYDLFFKLYDAAGNGAQIGTTVAVNGQTVSNGLFTINLDFGAACTGNARWLEIWLRTNNGPAYTVLNPRQELKPAPYALYAAQAASASSAAALSGSLAATQISGTLPDSLIPATVARLNSSPVFTGSVVATGNLSAGGDLHAARLWVGVNNYLGTGALSSVASGAVNTNLADMSFIGGGLANLIGTNADKSAIGGGGGNAIGPLAYYATIGGGADNVAAGQKSVVSGGSGNHATIDWATVGGGANNTASGAAATIPGGNGNTASGGNSFAAGTFAHAVHDGSFVWGDATYHDVYSTFPNQFLVQASGGAVFTTSSNVMLAVTAAGGLTLGGNFISALSDNLQFNIGVAGGPYQPVLRFQSAGSGLTGHVADAPNLVGGSYFNRIAVGALGSTIAGGGGLFHAGDSGWSNIIAGEWSTIGGGTWNTIAADLSTIGGGYQNTIATNHWSATIAGGRGNSVHANGDSEVIGGGGYNSIGSLAYSATIPGGWQNSIQDNAQYASIAGGESNTVASPYASIGGGQQNLINPNAEGSAIGGGQQNSSSSGAATIGGGSLNNVGTGANGSTIGGGAANTVGTGAIGATVSGGWQNAASGQYAAVGGGWQNFASAPYATVAGGDVNTNLANYSAIAGGANNTIQAGAVSSAIGGGSGNSVAGACGTVPGGANNEANAAYSFAAGYRAKADHQGSFVWADANQFDFRSVNTNIFMVRASGGVRFYSDSGGNTGVSLAPGSGSWSSISDRNAKENLTPVDPEEVLTHLAAIPMQSWNYKTQDRSIRHIGPMAQDFATAFQVGEDDRHISAIDADGVALAAIQGLNRKLEQTVKNKDKEIEALEQRLANLENLVNSLAQPPSR